jgi:hypothetical protein
MVNRLPVDSLVDMSIRYMDDKKLLENPSSFIFSGFNEASISSIVQIVCRGICAEFVYPKISTEASLINMTIGVVHLGIGFTHRFETMKTNDTDSKEWASIAEEIHKGVTHLLIAGYDYGIGYLIKQRYFDLITVVGFSTLPVVALMHHQMIFKKPESRLANSKEKPDETAHPYREKTCWIYIVAKKITLELMPNFKTQPPESIIKRSWKALRRLSYVESGESLPQFGL